MIRDSNPSVLNDVEGRASIAAFKRICRFTYAEDEFSVFLCTLAHCDVRPSVVAGIVVRAFRCLPARAFCGKISLVDFAPLNDAMLGGRR